MNDPYGIKRRHMAEIWTINSQGKCLFGEIVKDQNGLGMAGQLDNLLA